MGCPPVEIAVCVHPLREGLVLESGAYNGLSVRSSSGRAGTAPHARFGILTAAGSAAAPQRILAPARGGFVNGMRGRRPVEVCLLAAAVLLAGCVAGTSEESAGPDSGAGPASPAPAAQVNESTGSIAGLVQDPEGLPLAGVTVTVVETLASARSDAEGRFTFNGIEPGSYRLIGERLGYEDAASAVKVAADEVAEVSLTLVPVAVAQDPYHDSVVSTAYVKADYVLVSWAIWEVAHQNVSAYNQQFCDPCHFTIFLEPSPVQVLVETVWEKPVGAPGVNDEVWLAYYRNWTDEEGGTSVKTGYWSNREAVFFAEEDMEEVEGATELRLIVHGGLFSVNVDHRLDVWTTFAYHGELEEGFSALPPEE